MQMCLQRPQLVVLDRCFKEGCLQSEKWKKGGREHTLANMILRMPPVPRITATPSMPFSTIFLIHSCSRLADRIFEDTRKEEIRRHLVYIRTKPAELGETLLSLFHIAFDCSSRLLFRDILSHSCAGR
jgi:hypothetical protein